jgi:hypothetical protein
MLDTIDLDRLESVTGGATEMTWAVNIPGLSNDIAQVQQLGEQAMQGFQQQSQSLFQMFTQSSGSQQSANSTPPASPLSVSTPPYGN